MYINMRACAFAHPFGNPIIRTRYCIAITISIILKYSGIALGWNFSNNARFFQAARSPTITISQIILKFRAAWKRFFCFSNNARFSTIRSL